MTTQRNDVVVVEPSGLVRVCAWCLPATRLAEIHRAYRCTDGLCVSCEASLDEAPASRHLLHLQYPTGRSVTIGFPTAFDRALHMILLAAQPVTLRLEDREAA